MMPLTNIESQEGFNIDEDWHRNRNPGLSALVRVHNEAAWLEPSLRSIVTWCDEVIVVLNLCTDDSHYLADRVSREHPSKVFIYQYPFPIHPMGPGHDDCPADSVHASAYYYNWTQSKSTRQHVMKWDGDMVAMDWLGSEVKHLMRRGYSRIRFEGTDLVGDDLTHIGCHPRCPTNGIYKVRAATYYQQGPMTQNLNGLIEPSHQIDKPAFLHFKWARKPFESATVQWPHDWESIPHFQNIAQRRFPVALYDGEYPTLVREAMGA